MFLRFVIFYFTDKKVKQATTAVKVKFQIPYTMLKEFTEQEFWLLKKKKKKAPSQKGK